LFGILWHFAVFPGRLYFLCEKRICYELPLHLTHRLLPLSLLFSPLEGTKIYGTQHDVFKIFGNYVVTQEQLFYEFNIFIKYFSVIPVALLFVITTHPSEFASSLNRIGVPYKFSYAVSIALRYIPTVQEDFITISKAQQAKGIDISRNVKLTTRIKNVSYTLLPLIFSSIDKIDVISNAMLLRGFGKKNRRTWYQARKMKTSDIVAIFITAVFGTRLLLSLLVNSNIFNKHPGYFGVSKKSIHETKFGINSLNLSTKFEWLSFTKHMKKFFALSIAIMIAGSISLGMNKLNLGIDFSSGTRIDVVANTELSIDKVQEDLNNLKVKEEKIVLSPDKKQATVHSKESFAQDKSIEIKEYFAKKYEKDANLSVVSPVIGKELAKNALFALMYASIGIIIYVAFRFEWRMGLTSVIALLHDVCIIIFIASLLRLEIDITFIAAVLTIVGYSINDTIVTFDRIREHMRHEKVLTSKEQIYKVVDVSLRQTLTRSINTVLTVIITVVVMLLLGSSSIYSFNVALLIGLIFGLYSSLFIAAQLWAVLKVRELNKKGKIEVSVRQSPRERKENDKVLV